MNAFAGECKLSGCALMGEPGERVSLPAFAGSQRGIARLEGTGKRTGYSFDGAERVPVRACTEQSISISLRRLRLGQIMKLR